MFPAPVTISAARRRHTRDITRTTTNVSPRRSRSKSLPSLGLDPPCSHTTICAKDPFDFAALNVWRCERFAGSVVALARGRSSPANYSARSSCRAGPSLMVMRAPDVIAAMLLQSCYCSDVVAVMLLQRCCCSDVVAVMLLQRCCCSHVVAAIVVQMRVFGTMLS